MMYFALATAISICVWSGLSIFIVLRRRRAFPAPPPPDAFPTVSVLVAARDEETAIESAMGSLLALDYPALEVIAINDRSSDGTGALLDRLAREHPGRLRVLHISELPDGWLGKCHALARGSEIARGEWLLFTDADVVFDQGSLRVAMAHACAHRADHVVFAPRLEWEHYIEAALLTLFWMSLAIAFRTWRIETPSRRAFIGLGGFNMVRRRLYDRFGGHSTLRLEVADDMKLGYLAKKHGGRSVLVDSEGTVRVRWRNGTRDVIRGLERSGFAGVDFRWSAIVMSALFFIGIMLAPYALLVFGDSTSRFLAACALAALTIAYGVVARASKMPRWIGLLHPVACVLFAWAFVRSAIMTTRDGGLSWRGNFYSISELRRGTVH